MASQNRTSVVSDIVKATFRAKASMSDAHWKEIGAVLQRANECCCAVQVDHRVRFALTTPD
jgi:hypothetical protein